MSRSRSLLSLLLLTLAVPALAAAPKPVASRADVDSTCAPCRDFDRFANGPWLARTTLPAGYSDYGAFDELYDRNEAVLRRILERALATPRAKADRNTAMLRDYYGACMDSAGAERDGGRPIVGLLADLDALPSTKDLGRQVAWLHQHGVNALFRFGAEQDDRDSRVVLGTMRQSGLGLPERGYYLRTDSASVATRAVYLTSMTNLLQLTGESAATASGHASAVMALETALAQASKTAVERRDPKANYNRLEWDALVALAPRFDWAAYRDGRGFAAGAVNVRQTRFVQAMDSLIAAVPLDTWKAYLKVRVLFDAAPTLSSPYVKEWFALRSALTGTTELLPRWKRCIAETDDALGEVLGQSYVKEAFTPQDKARMLTMVHRLREAQADVIARAPWMGDSTRVAAKVKLDAFAENIGYPSTWKDYAGVTLRPDAHYANRGTTRAYEYARDMAKIGKPVDRTAWEMTPPTVNAYYDPQLNSINFPAGILQPPFFDKDADDATNYGAIGAVIGHEMGHGFDDQGRQYDADGNLRDWWTPADVARYKTLADSVRVQFDRYTVLDTLHVNGSLTLGENLADLGGLAVAYVAMQKAYASQPRTRIHGFTPEQRFFLGWARVWRNLSTDGSLRTLVQTNPHAPAQWRINGPMSNLKEFHEAWGCQPGDALVPPTAQQTRIW